MKEKLIKFLEKELKFKLDYEKLLEKPKIKEHGDFSFPCFILAKEMKISPQDISTKIKEQLDSKLPNFIEKVENMGPFLNFYLNSKLEAKQILESFEDKSILEYKCKNPQKILIEYPSPNTNKSLHLGHVRNILIGNSLSKILKKTNNKIIRTNLNNDRGIAVCKSMLGYELFFKDKTPKSENLKPDEFISMCYVKFELESQKDNSLNDDAQKMLLEWEENYKEVRALWKKVLKMVFEGYKETYKNYKLEKFDKEYFESQIYDKGKDIVLKAFKDKVKGFEQEEDGAIYCNLEDIGLDKKYLLRSDGTTLYMTQDIYLANQKQKDFKTDKQIFIVAKEQEYHFKVLFEILSRLNPKNKNNNFHFAYGYVYDKDGKKFSSRKGKTIGADWLLEEVINKAKENLLQKELTKDLNKTELEKRAKIIGFAALAFSFLKVNPTDDIKFDIERSLSFEGETAPYIQYTYARIKSLTRKAKTQKISIPKLKDINLNLLEEKEIALLKILKEYPSILEETQNKFKISAIANYLIKISQSFNDFYQTSQIVDNQNIKLSQARLLLSENTSKILKDGLELLGIEVLEEM